jgi:hypothetical protein
MLRPSVNASAAVVLAVMRDYAKGVTLEHPILEKLARQFRSRWKVLRRTGAGRELLNIINNQ